MSSEPATPVAKPPGDSGSELIAELLPRLNGDDPRLIAFARSFARRERLEQLDDATVGRLAAQIAGLFRMVDARRGEIGVRAFNPSEPEDGYETHGTVVQANTDDAPFLIDTVSEELRRHGLEVRIVLHPVMGIDR
ncbi:MAG: glutamate dehydrogenase, partial [Gaiellales bacterium]|nr:glutamate dehydrogenase [Gaiellales bacterium]